MVERPARRNSICPHDEADAAQPIEGSPMPGQIRRGCVFSNDGSIGQRRTLAEILVRIWRGGN